jgi:hypothetical protein
MSAARLGYLTPSQARRMFGRGRYAPTVKLVSEWIEHGAGKQFAIRVGGRLFVRHDAVQREATELGRLIRELAVARNRMTGRGGKSV